MSRKLIKKKKVKQTVRQNVKQKVIVKVGGGSAESKKVSQPSIQYIPMPQYIPQYVQQNVPQLTKEDIRTLIRSEIPDRVRFEEIYKPTFVESKETMTLPVSTEEKETMYRPKVKTIETETEPISDFNISEVAFEPLVKSLERLRPEDLPSLQEKPIESIAEDLPSLREPEKVPEKVPEKKRRLVVVEKLKRKIEPEEIEPIKTTIYDDLEKIFTRENNPELYKYGRQGKINLKNVSDYWKKRFGADLAKDYEKGILNQRFASKRLVD